MPEGDSVLQLSERLQWMTGRTVTRMSVRVPRFATVDLSGQRVGAVWPYGKHLFMLVGEHIIHTHLKMEGVWAIHAAGSRWRKPAFTARIVLRLSPQHPGGPDIEIVGHELGFVRIYPARTYPQIVAHLGPDLLSPAWESPWVAPWHDPSLPSILSDAAPASTTAAFASASASATSATSATSLAAVRHAAPGASHAEEACARIAERPERALGAALLDQKNVAGVGNEYRAEIMFLLGLHPAVSVAEAGPEKVAASIALSRRVMWENRLSPGRVFTGDKRPGMTDYVFGRNHRECRRCGDAIRKAELGGPDAGGDRLLDAAELERIIWWCPSCQPAPAGWRPPR